MEQTTNVIGYLASSQLLLTGLFYFIFFRKSNVGALLVLNCVCLLVVMFPYGFESTLLNYVLGRIGAATPALLWLFAHALFTDDRKVTVLEWFFLISYILARGVATYANLDNDGAENSLFNLMSLYGLLVALGLAVHVIYLAMREFRHDLLEERRVIRGPFAAGLGVVMALLVAALLSPQFLSEADSSRFSEVVFLISKILIFLFFLAINLLTLQLAPDTQLVVANNANETGKYANRELQLAESDLELVQELDRRMMQEKLFVKPELTIGQLAEYLSVQEYKLRVIINRELGYRNFNQFLNHYRINEACTHLEKKTSYRNISIVAQDVGYVSLSTFNQAFKKLKGVTPTEYKASHIQN